MGYYYKSGPGSFTQYPHGTLSGGFTVVGKPKKNEYSVLTEYSIIEVAGKKLLQAKSDSSASGIAKELTIDLKKTPYLNWSWKVDSALGQMDETSKQGDDYAARLYVVKKGGWQIWKTIALNYVKNYRATSA